jgi:glucose/arabinose dehydrogenase/plastocyanin
MSSFNLASIRKSNHGGRARFLATVVTLLALTEAGLARPWRPGQLPNGGVFSCANCHIDPGGGGPRNPFGQAVEAELISRYGNAFGEPGGFWGPTLALQDSDGDAFTNGEELSDPAGIWTPGTPNPAGPVTNPGNPNSHPANAAPTVTITNPVSGSVLITPAHVTIDVAAIDSDGTISRVEFYDGTIPLGTNSSGPYSLSVALSVLGEHRLTATATDNRGARSTSEGVLVTVQPPGTPPTVSIISPTNGTVFSNTPATLFLQASATDNDGSVTNVEFLDGTVSLGSDSAEPFAIAANIAYGGTHLLTAIARDNVGWASTSSVVSISVEGVRLWSVDILDHTFVPATLTITAGDTVRWTVRGSLNHTVTSADGRFSAADLTNGDGSTYEVTFARAGTYAYLCAYHTSSTIGTQRGTIVVVPVVAPVVAITEPTNNAVFTTHDVVSLSAAATDADGTVNLVEFLDSGELLGAVTNEPFRLTYQFAPGPHLLTARATDNQDGRTTSIPVTIEVLTVPITNPIAQPIPKGDLTIELRTVAEGLASPLGMAVPGDGSGRMFIYDQSGVIRVLTTNGLLTEPLLDLRSNQVTAVQLVALGSYDERGLLGVVTHTNFSQFPLLYTYTSESNTAPADFTSIASNHNHQSVIAEWRIDATQPNQIDPASRRELLRIDQPQVNHNGGTMRFGPDGYLYIALGDGGRADDQGDGHEPEGNAQTLWNVYGKLLRIDVDSADSLNGQYGIPFDNPFYGWGMVDEVFAYGLRNPFSFSFDRGGTNALYLGDVGQNKVEEINLIVAGGNYGWRIKEGTFFFDPNGTNAGYVTDTPVVEVPPDLVGPIAQYDHDDGLAAIGGYVYRGSALPQLEGRYIFADWGSFGAPSGRLFYLDDTNGIKEFRLGLDDRALGYWIKGFGEDAHGELYVMASRSLGPSGDTGRVFKIVAPPEPVRIATVTADPAGATVTFTWTASLGDLYQLQYRNTLDQTDWTNWGPPLIATNSLMSSSDAIGPDPQRFYRVVPLP